MPPRKGRQKRSTITVEKPSSYMHSYMFSGGVNYVTAWGQVQSSLLDFNDEPIAERLHTAGCIHTAECRCT